MSSARADAGLRGVFALLLTPFAEDGSIDWSTYDRYVDRQIELGAHGLFASCGSSELKYLEWEERLALARRAVERAGTLPVVAVANAEPDVSRHHDELSRMADTGVSGVVFIPPPGMGVDQTKLQDYFAEMADRAPVPVILYEIPSSKPKDIAPETYGALVRETSVRGIKDTGGTLAGSIAKMVAAPGGVLFQAVAPFLLETIRAGGTGAMVIASTGACDLVVDLFGAATGGAAAVGEPVGGPASRGRSDSAEDAQRLLTYLNAVLELGYVATAKYLVSLRGVPMGLTCRSGSTLSPMAAKSVETIAAELSHRYPAATTSPKEE